MKGCKTLFTCRSGIELLNMGSTFGAWDETWQDTPADGKETYKIFVPEADIEELHDAGCFDVINILNVIVDTNTEEVEG